MIVLMSQYVFLGCSKPSYQLTAAGNQYFYFCSESCCLCAVPAAWSTPMV